MDKKGKLQEGYVRPEDSSFSKGTNRIVTGAFLLMSFVVFLPILLVFIVSFSSEQSVTAVGYSFFPQSLSTEAYRYLFRSGSYITRAFFNSLFITAAGTLLGLALMCPMAYALSRREFRYGK